MRYSRIKFYVSFVQICNSYILLELIRFIFKILKIASFPPDFKVIKKYTFNKFKALCLNISLIHTINILNL